MTPEQSNIILHTIQNDKYSFGQSLRYIRQAQGISLRKVASAVNRTPTYISDIERGNNRPPEPVLLKELLKALAMDQASVGIQDYLYDLAARERGEVSGDITEYIMAQNELRKLIRLAQQKSDIGGLWQECISKLQ
ncbi:MAG: helix-turn-helix domain-containing protein [Muribaculaceae bacterium]|nr:helix-turn-helix domain-containing protein [Muribaculaceae bacterium]MCM1494081.1 helix-turn-helix domain-containing protein [Muribaculaceae bacterium]MCM1561344.1 helix-turn-helix domain-containing protein [Butyrivibrio sp.]